MTVDQALSILFGSKDQAERTEDAVKRAYRAKAKEYHPDRGGDVELMKLLNLAYETLQKVEFSWADWQEVKARGQQPLTQTMREMWEAVKDFPGITVEIIGTWMWVSGNTKAVKEELKAHGFKFARSKMAWYFHEGYYRKRSKEAYSMDGIRDMWGYEVLRDEKEEQKQHHLVGAVS